MSSSSNPCQDVEHCFGCNSNECLGCRYEAPDPNISNALDALYGSAAMDEEVEKAVRWFFFREIAVRAAAAAETFYYCDNCGERGAGCTELRLCNECAVRYAEAVDNEVCEYYEDDEVEDELDNYYYHYETALPGDSTFSFLPGAALASRGLYH